MSFKMELAASWARSPVKAARKIRRRTMNETSDEVPKRSPTRIMDFPMEDFSDELEEDEETINAISIDRSSIVRQLALAPLDINAPQDIAPIPPYARERNKKNIKTLPTLDEQTHFENLSYFSTSVNTVIKVKKKSTLPKPTRAERIQELIEEASECACTGDEDEAIKVYKKAIRIAETEVTKLRGQLHKSLEKHPVALQSIQTRIQQDMLELVLLCGKIKTNMTDLYERQGDYENAIETCKEVRSIYRKQKKRSPLPAPRTEIGNTSPGSKRSGESERSIVWYVACPNIEKLASDASFLLDRLTQAQASYDDRKKMIEEILMLRQEIGVTVDARERSKLYSRAEAMAKKAVITERTSLGTMHPQVADALQLLSTLVLEQQNEKPNNRDRAIQYLLQGLEINQTTLGKKHPRTGQDLLRMARLYQQPVVPGVALDVSRSRQDEDRAIEYFRLAADVFRSVKSGYKIVGSILNDLAVIYVARRDFCQALELLQESLASYEAEVAEESSEAADDTSGTVVSICIDVVQVWRNMGECHMNLRDFKQAIECCINALDTQRDARQKHDSVSEFDDLESVGEEKSFLVHLMQMINDDSIADTLRRLGKAFAAAGKFREAMVVYNEAMQIHRTAVSDAGTFAKFRFNPELPGKQDQLANTLFCIAEVHDATTDYAAAVRVFNESMQLRISSDGHRPQSQRCNMVHCAMCLVGIANVHFKKKEYVEAHKLYSNALFFCEAQGIPFNHAIVTMIEHRRKEAENKVVEDPNRVFELLRLEEKAESERRRGELDKAISTLGETMTIRMACTENLKASGLDTSAEIAATVRLLHTFGHVYADKGDDEKSQRAHRDAIRLFKKCAPPKSSA